MPNVQVVNLYGRVCYGEKSVLAPYHHLSVYGTAYNMYLSAIDCTPHSLIAHLQPFQKLRDTFRNDEDLLEMRTFQK